MVTAVAVVLGLASPGTVFCAIWTRLRQQALEEEAASGTSIRPNVYLEALCGLSKPYGLELSGDWIPELKARYGLKMLGEP